MDDFDDGSQFFSSFFFMRQFEMVDKRFITSIDVQNNERLQTSETLQLSVTSVSFGVVRIEVSFLQLVPC